MTTSFLARRRFLGLPSRPKDYIRSLLSLVPRHRKSLMAEVGVFRGDCAARLLLVRRRLSMVLVDAYKHDETATAGNARAFCNFTQQRLDEICRETQERLSLFGSRAQFVREQSTAAAELFANQTFDIAFIDADHRYSAVKGDLVAWWRKVRKGGIMCGHDYQGPLDLTGEWGVARAVNEFVATATGIREFKLLPGRIWCIQKAKRGG